jgi:NAD(P)-dependent dehydrogenase (short-subunit alcohol dehydrogenase family)
MLLMKELAGRTVVITGGAGGIGLSLARALGREQMKIAVAEIDTERGEGAAELLRNEGLDATSFAVDVTSQTSTDELLRAVLAHYGEVGVLCNNAGVSILHQKFLDSTPEDWNFVFKVNVFGMANCLRSFVAYFRSTGQPHHIVTTASMSGLRPSRASLVYMASKYAVVGLAEGAQREFRDTAIGFSLLAPGAFVTDLANTSARARDLSHGTELASGQLDVIDATEGPEAVGDLVVDGIRNDLPYIFTHLELWPEIEARFLTMRGCLPEYRG